MMIYGQNDATYGLNKVGKVKKTPRKVAIGPNDGQDLRSIMRPTPRCWVRCEGLFDIPLLKWV